MGGSSWPRLSLDDRFAHGKTGTADLIDASLAVTAARPRATTTQALVTSDRRDIGPLLAHWGPTFESSTSKAAGFARVPNGQATG